MPAKSKAQQKAAGAALGARRGSGAKLYGAAASMARSMSEKQLKEYAGGSQKRKPEHAAKGRNGKKKT